MPFLIGLIASQKLYLVGELYVGEVMAVAYVVSNIKRLFFGKNEKTIIAFSMLWAAAQLVSDILNKNDISDSIKGIFSPVVFIISFIFLNNYARINFARVPSLLTGVAVGGLIQLFLHPNEFFIFNPWKWGVGHAVIGIFVIYFSFYLKNKNNLFLFSALIVFLGITLLFDSRGMAIFPVLAALAYKKYYGKNVSGLSRRLSGEFTGFKILLIAIPSIFILNSAASALFSSEIVLSRLTSYAAAKYKIQATGSFGILLGGRSEILVSSKAFLDKPLLGHGSWPKDKSKYLDEYSMLITKYGYSLREDGGYEDIEERPLIPTHSFLMGALVWAGVVGGIFWLIVLNTTLKIFIKDLNLFPLYYYVGMLGLVWNIFFSPFSADARWSTAVFLAAFFSFFNYLKFNPELAS